LRRRAARRERALEEADPLARLGGALADDPRGGDGSPGAAVGRVATIVGHDEVAGGGKFDRRQLGHIWRSDAPRRRPPEVRLLRRRVDPVEWRRVSGGGVSEDVAAGPVATARRLGDLRPWCSGQLENGLLDLGRPSRGIGHLRSDRVKARLLKDSQRPGVVARSTGSDRPN
jgi:hypothetical protein